MSKYSALRTMVPLAVVHFAFPDGQTSHSLAGEKC